MSIILSFRRLAPVAVVTIGLALGSCSDLLTESPPHIIVPDNLYLDATGFEAGLASLYSKTRRERERVRGGTHTTGSSDIVMGMWTIGTDVGFSPSEGNYRALNRWGVEMNPEYLQLLPIWLWLYETVNGANTIINRADNPQVRWTENQKNQILAEAKFFRAWAYRHLTYLWGDVPLNIEESSGSTIRTDWERTPVAEVRRQMEQDLLFAEQHLPTTPASEGRLVQAAAKHFLAELYLAMSEPAKAEQKAAEIINSGQYSLITERYGVTANEPGVPFMDQFRDGNVNRGQGNTEVIWVLENQQNVIGEGLTLSRRAWTPAYERNAGVQVSVEFGGRGTTRLAATRWALDNYEPQDDRASHHAIRRFLLMNDPNGLPAGRQLGDTVWLNHNRNERVAVVPDWPWPRKWQWADPAAVIGTGDYQNKPLLRLAETYLVLAEAQFYQGKLSDAAESLNVVRRRANASEITPGQVTIDFILDERARELLAEEHRRHHLVRTGTYLDRTRRLNPIVTGQFLQDHNVLLPIPQAVIDANLDRPMPQNPGY
jgi:starch-binding outer membrane protein, SusD/RagB family